MLGQEAHLWDRCKTGLSLQMERMEQGTASSEHVQFLSGSGVTVFLSIPLLPSSCTFSLITQVISALGLMDMG